MGDLWFFFSSFFLGRPSGFDIVMLKLSPGICGVSLFLSNTVTQQQTLSLQACFSFIFYFSRNLNRFDFFRETSPFAPGSCEEKSVRRKQRVGRGRSTCCHVFVGGLCCLPSPPSLPLPPTSLPPLRSPPRLFLPAPALPTACLSLAHSLCVSGCCQTPSRCQ